MDVVLGVHGHVEVHDVADLGHVDAAREHVGGHEDVGLAGTERIERALALVLFAIAVDGLARDPGPAQATAARVDAVLRAAEHDYALGALGLEHLREQRVFGLERDGLHILVDGLGDGALARDLDHGRVAHEVADPAHGVLVQCRREEQRLSRDGRPIDDPAHVGQEAHVEHAVGLVEHEHLDLAQARVPLVDEVDEAAGRGHEDVGPAAKRGLLGLHAHTADHRGALVAGAARDRGADVLDLLGKLAGGGHDEHERAVAALGVGQAAHRGQQERGGLAGAGLGGGKKVAALEDIRDGLRLDGGGLGVAELLHGGEDGLGKPEIAEGDALGGAGGIALGHEIRILTSGPICGALLCKQPVYFSATDPPTFSLQKNCQISLSDLAVISACLIWQRFLPVWLGYPSPPAAQRG